MNMVEIWFGILTNQAIRRGSFDSVARLIGPMNAPSSAGGTKHGEDSEIVEPNYEIGH